MSMKIGLHAGILFTIAVLVSGFTASAQRNTDSSITGHVTDEATGEHLPFVTVMLKGTMIGTLTIQS